jgi:1-acyl-sn-glycerol-3-phosphate acyltransferase
VLVVLSTIFVPTSWLGWYVGTFCGSVFLVRGKAYGYEHYLRLKYTNLSSAIIFNHPAFFDVIPICFALRCFPKLVVNQAYMRGLLYYIAKKLGILLVDKQKTGNSVAIVKHIQERKAGDEILCICPTGVIAQAPTGVIAQALTGVIQTKGLETFHKSAFLQRNGILPINIIYLDPLPVWTHQSLLRMCIDRILSGKVIHFEVHILPAMAPFTNESIDDFIQRVRLVYNNNDDTNTVA